MAKIFDMLVKREEHFKQALGSKRDFGGWFASMKTWVMQKEIDKFQDYTRVTPQEILAAYTAAAQLGLLIDGEECMVMIRGKKTPKIKCEIGAKGVVRKAGDAGWFVNARTIKEGDQFEIDEGIGHVRHTPGWLCGMSRADAANAETLGYYAVARRRGGITIVRAMSFEDAQDRSTGTGAWTGHPDPMGEKSAILSLRKVLHFGDEMENLIAATGAVVGGDWATSAEEQDAAEAPTHPPRSTRDHVMAEAERVAQDADAEAGQAHPQESGEEGGNQAEASSQPVSEEADLPM